MANAVYAVRSMPTDEYDYQNDENIPEADPTVPQVDFAYAEYPVHRKCGNCNMYVPGRKCTMVKDDIDPEHGVCSYWSIRDTKPIEGKEYEPMMSKEDAGYITNGPTHCGNCKFYIDPRMCEMVRGDIDPDTGCCTAWQKGESTEAFYGKIFKILPVAEWSTKE